MELPTQRSDGASDPAGDAFTLTVVKGPSAGLAVTLEPTSPARLLIGKSVTCSLRLDDPEVSRRHASVRTEGRGLLLSDLGSTNGTHVNNVAVREALLGGGEAIRVGRTVITVSRGGPSSRILSPDTAFGRVIGGSRQMRALYPLLARFAAIGDALLLEGEIGTGKELVAEELHLRSRRSGSFVAVTTQTLAPEAMEAQVAEAITQSSGGTVYIDEIASLPYALQRTLAARLTNAGARLIFGTRRDLDRDVERGTFVEELLTRLAPFVVELPPLRDRTGDVELLASVFWGELAGDPSSELPHDFVTRFHRYRWPGNVRELALAVASRFHRGELGRWEPSALAGDEADTIRSIIDRELPLTEARQLVIDELERRYVLHMVERHGSTKAAAQAAGVGLRYFQILRARFQA